MKFRSLTKEEKFVKRREYEQNWHTHFAFRPVRLDSSNMVWFETVLRRRTYDWAGRPDKWEYKESVFDLIRDN